MTRLDLEPGTRVRLKYNPGRVGTVTGKAKEYGGLRRWQIVFPDRPQYVADDQLEIVGPEGDDALDLLQRDRLGGELDLRRTITHARLTGRLADVIYSMDTTGTDFYAHQFKPVVKLMNSAGRGMLIADEVGLGKTIEAGLVWTELRTRFDFRRLLVLCPAVLREKWERELRRRFGVDADVLDATKTLSRLRHAEEEGHTASFAIVASLQGLRPAKGWNDPGEKQDGAASKLARFLEGVSQNDPLIDLCVIDEAHHLRNPRTMTATLGRLVRAVSDYILLLSATPIHLKNADLYELVRHVDPDTFDRRDAFNNVLQANGPLVRARDLVLPGGHAAASTREALERELHRAYSDPLLAGSQQLRELIDSEVWRMDLSQPDTVASLAERLDRVNLLGHVVTRTRRHEVEERKVIRDVKALVVPLSLPESAFYDTVTEIVRDYCILRDVNEGFLQVTPQRQMCSSMPAALRLWLQQEPGDDTETGEDPDELERPLRAELVANARSLGDLDELWRNDSKYEQLRGQLRSLLRENEKEKIVVFSYFRSTLRYLHERLRQDGVHTTLLHGGVSDKDEVILAFRERDDINVLLSSEVGSEGIDLQFARVVVNYDLPWNPMRVEQRIGRIDRLGQTAQKIHVRNLFYGETIDDRIYHKLFKALGVFEHALGALEPVLGNKIQKLVNDLFSKHLTPEEEEGRIEQTRLALANQRLQEERLETEAPHLVAYGDYILKQVQAARELHRTISAKDLQSYVIDFFNVHYPGSEFKQIQDDPPRFEVHLSADARFELEKYLKEQRIHGSTRLVHDVAGAARYRFENTAVRDTRGRDEAISQFHPLVRFVASRLEAATEKRRPAVAVRLATADLQSRRLDLPPGRYAFSVQRWLVQGLRDMERLHYAAVPLRAGAPALQTRQAEQLVVAAAATGVAWLSARPADLDEVFQLVTESCLAPSEEAFRRYVADLKKENEDRADLQERMLDRHHKAQRGRIEGVLRRHEEQGRRRLIAATEGRLRALNARTERRQKEIDERRELKYDPPEVMCVGIIDVAAETARRGNAPLPA